MSEATEAASPQAEAPESGSGGLDAILNSALENYGDDTPAQAAPETTDPEPKDDRPRDEMGRFVPKESAKAEAPEPGPAEVAANPEPAPAPEPAPVETQPIQPPAKWSESEKAEFAKLPKPIQEWLVKRDGETEATFTRKTQELAETRKAIEPLLGEVQTLNPLFQRIGMTPHQFLRESAIVADRLTSGSPEQQGQAIAYLTQLHRIPPEAVLAAMGIPISPAGDGAAINPVETQLRHKLSDVERQLQQMNERWDTSERQRAEAEFKAVGQTKDDNGQLKYPHFERVSQTMIRLVADGQAETWEQAYAKAVRLDDDLYKQTLEAERQRVAAEAERARQDAVEKAKKAQPVKSSSVVPQGGTVRKGLDAHLGAALDRAGFGG